MDLINVVEKQKAMSPLPGNKLRTLCLLKSYIFRDIMPCSLFESQPTFRRNISLPSSGSKNKPSKKPA
jgi:hypothetical protein